VVRKEDSSDDAYVLHILPDKPQEITQYLALSDILGVALPEAWRPDGGVVAKFRDKTGHTIFVRPAPFQSASDAIIEALEKSDIINSKNNKGG
jgi:hypothetical protein